MNDVGSLDTRLADCLRDLSGPDAEVRVQSADRAGYKFFGWIVSPTFEGLNEGRRQSAVWGRLLRVLSEEDVHRIEFVSTLTPDEDAKQMLAASR